MKRKSNKAQHLFEYATLISLVIASLVAGRIFFTRIVQDKFRQSADVFGSGEQYERGVTTIGSSSGRGEGEIGEPAARDICLSIAATVNSLESQIISLNARAGEFDARANETLGQIQELEGLIATIGGMDPRYVPDIQQRIADVEAQITSLRSTVATFRENARAARQDAWEKHNTINRLKLENPDCFAG